MTRQCEPAAARLGRGAWLVMAALVATGLWLLRWHSAKAQYMGDSYSYAHRAYQIAGYRPPLAGTKAAEVACQWLQPG